MSVARSHARLVTTTVAVLAVVIATLVATRAVGAQPGKGVSALQDRLSTILDDPRLDGAQNSLTVRDADTGATLYDSNGATRLLPASNAKIFTSAAAMDVLGPNYRFHTVVAHTGKLTGSTLHGNLYLRGYGDPTATAKTYERLARDVAASGIRTVAGTLDADDSYFDDVRLAPFWSWDDEPYYYSAQTSALNIAPDTIGDTGTVLIDVFPGARAGDPVRVKMIPSNGYVRIHDTATTGSSSSTQTVRAVREYGRNIIDVTGSIPKGAANYASQPTVDDPTGLAADVFRRALARNGVTVEGGATTFEPTPAGTTRVAADESITLSNLLVPFLKLSNNMIAEALTKAMGEHVSGEGTWSAGTAAILADAKANGADTDTLQLFDGSGLGRADYLTSDQLTDLMLALRDKPWFHTWYEALPIAGNPKQLVGGTLRDRMVGTAAANNLHGKTGSETGVSALSGYLTDKRGDHLVFSMLSNNFVEGGITDLEDAVAITLAKYDGTDHGSAVHVAPAPASRPDRQAQLECSWTRSC